MAIAATVQWDVRTTGSDTNGGGFDPSVTSPGTDFSQQSSPQITYTDLVIGATNTQLTSVGNPFNSTYVGNLINITGGTGFTTGRYEVKSVSGTTATMDRAVGTASSTGGAGKLGGSMATPGAALAAIVTLNGVWLQAGTYTVTTAIIPTTSASFSLIGYSATHGDNVAGAIITTSTNSTILLSIPSGTSGSAWVQNIALSNTASTRADGIKNLNNLESLTVSNCTLTGFANAIAGQGGVDGSSFLNLTVLNTYITGSTGNAIIFAGALLLLDSVLSGNTGNQITTTTSNAAVLVSRSLIVGGGAVGLSFTTGQFIRVVDSTIAYNTGDGIGSTSNSWFANGGAALTVQNSVIYGNGGWGLNLLATSPANVNIYVRNNAWGGNTSGNYRNAPAGAGDVTLTNIPFTNHSTGDYSLNTAGGGGAACRGVGYPGLFAGGNSTGYLDVGAVQSNAANAFFNVVPVAAALQGGTVGVSYSETITAQGGTSPYTFAVTSGSTPGGTSLSSSGVISGTPTGTGSSTFTVTATDANSITGSQSFTIVISGPSGGSFTYVM